MMENKGKIVQVSGPVVDVEFADGNLGKQLVKDAHLCIFRTEIVSPL